MYLDNATIRIKHDNDTKAECLLDIINSICAIGDNITF